MDLRHLKYFVAVADERSFTNAAVRLHISQSPLSRQIQQLEEEVGLPLFQRDSRPLNLTEAGRFFYERAVSLLTQADQALSTTRRIAQLEQRLVVGFVASTMYDPLPKIVRWFQSACPDIELALQDMSTVEQIDALKAGRIDVGFGRIRLEDPVIRRLVLRNERLVVAVPMGHTLSVTSAPVGIADVAKHPLLVYPRSPRPSYADQVLSLFHDHGTQPAYIHEVQEIQTALGLVSAGMGLCIVPESVQRLRADEVIYRPLRDADAISPIIMSTRLHDQSAGVCALQDLVQRAYLQAPTSSVGTEA